MSSASVKISHEQFCEFLEGAVVVVDLSDGGQLAKSSDGKVAHFSAITGEGCILPM